MSQRHYMVDEDDRLLDAARACVLAVGVRRTTVTDVARRARREPDDAVPANSPTSRACWAR